MLNEPHYPSKWSAAVVFGIILLLIGGIFSWAFYFNFGTLELISTRNFNAAVNGKTYSCLTRCDISLPPNSYDVLVQSEGHYDQSFTMNIVRWDTAQAEFAFQLVPYLKQSSLTEVPVEEPRASFRTESGSQVLYVTMETGDQAVTDFESLKEPVVRVSEKNAIVLDSGRAFFVDLLTGGKIRRFDDTVQISDALLSDRGNRVLFFVELQGNRFIWMWDNEENQLTPLPWYEPVEALEWEVDQDHRIFVVTDQLTDPSQSSLLDQLSESAGNAPKVNGLFFYNLDSGEARQVATFGSEKPTLFRRGDLYFLKYQDGSIDELVVR